MPAFVFGMVLSWHHCAVSNSPTFTSFHLRNSAMTAQRAQQLVAQQLLSLAR